MEPIPDSFPKFHKRLREIALSSDAKSASDKVVHQLPPSIHQLARLAEQTPEFDQLAIDLFPGSHTESPGSETLADLIKRSGYYHSLLDGEAPEPFWQKIVDRIPFREREVKHLRLLEGCRFPKDRFSIAGHSVVRMSDRELAALGPEPRAAWEFYPEEFLARRWLTERWFLEKGSLEWTGYVSDREASLGLDLSNIEIREMPKEIAAGVTSLRKTPRRDRDYMSNELELPDYVAPVLILSLYDASFFEIPLSLVCEPGWRVLQSKLNFAPFETNSISLRAAKYEVRPDAWENFERFVRTCESGLKYIRTFWSRRFVTAARHYLRATFAKEDVWYHWDTSWLSVEYPEVSGRSEPDNVAEDVLLHYVFALEALFNQEIPRFRHGAEQDERDSIGKRLAKCASLLIAVNPQESAFVKKLISVSYSARSRLVHGQPLVTDLDFLKLRRVIQRTLSVILFLAADFWVATGGPEWENLDPDARAAEVKAILEKLGSPPEKGSETPNKQRQPSPKAQSSVPDERIAKAIFNLWNFGTSSKPGGDVLKARTGALKFLAGGERPIG